jgi:hypothetical protein
MPYGKFKRQKSKNKKVGTLHFFKKYRQKAPPRHPNALFKIGGVKLKKKKKK